jgi:hypothetical protein
MPASRIKGGGRNVLTPYGKEAIATAESIGPLWRIVEETIRSALQREFKRGLRIGAQGERAWDGDATSTLKLYNARKAGVKAGIRQAARFAGSFDKQITQTEYKFEDIILVKFNLLARHKMRRKSQ